MGLVRSGSGILVHETLRSALFENKFMNRADFLIADSDAIAFD